ncbi:MAG: biopolymer transporter ExbD [Burkholderiaceae bacterium]
MSMNVGSAISGEPEVMIDINTTPLIDVMLVLLIMFIITIPVQLNSVNLNLPSGTPPPLTTEPAVVTIDVDFDGTILWNGDALPSRGALQARLREAAARADPPEVHVRPNKLVEYKYVAEVLAESQRLGITRLGLVGNEQFVP